MSLRELMAAAATTVVVTTLVLSPVTPASADAGPSASGAAQPAVTEDSTWRVRHVGSIGTAVEFSFNARDFQLSVGVLGIGGSVKVQPTGDTYTGNIGPENRLGDPPSTSWNINRVNAFYAAPSNFIWDGSPDFQGNVAQVLYEWYWDEPPTASIWGMANVWAHCGRSLGLCDDFN